VPDVGRAKTFVVSIVPLGQIRFDYREFAQPRQLTCLPSALHRAGEHLCETDLAKTRAKFPRLVFAAHVKGNVCATGVPTG
jgi:hypothetical protein